MRRLDGQATAAGEVGGVLEVQPERGVGKGLGVAGSRSYLHRQLQAPFRALPVAVGELVGGEGDADPAAQLFANGVDDAVRSAAGSRVLAQCEQPPPPLFPLEESVLERVILGHRPIVLTESAPACAMRRWMQTRPPA